MLDWKTVLLLLVPSYVANSVPILTKGLGPIDGGARLPDGERVFGKNKTVGGFLGGVVLGVVGGIVEYLLFRQYLWDLFPSIYGYLYFSFLMSFGTMFGDLAGSFVKRRMRLRSGKQSLLLDQLGFITFALLFSFPVAPSILYEIDAIAFIYALTFLMHIGTNYLANKAGIKNVPW